MNDQQKHLSELFANLLDTPNHDDRERLIENEACLHRITRPLDIFLLESICKLAQENAKLKLALWEYENNYRQGKYENPPKPLRS